MAYCPYADVEAELGVTFTGGPSSDVCPGLSVANTGNGLFRDAELVPQGSEAGSISQKRANGQDIAFCKFRFPMLFTDWIAFRMEPTPVSVATCNCLRLRAGVVPISCCEPSTIHRIVGILERSPRIQMIRSHARWIIATVQGELTIIENHTTELEHDARGAHGLPPICYKAVLFGVPSPGPWPASIDVRFVDSRPNVFGKGFVGCVKTCFAAIESAPTADVCSLEIKDNSTLPTDASGDMLGTHSDPRNRGVTPPEVAASRGFNASLLYCSYALGMDF